MSSGVLMFCWQVGDPGSPNGTVENWWSDDLGRQRKRFVHREWGQFAIGIDLARGEAQIQFNHPPEWRIIKFADLPDENTRLAFEAICDTNSASFAAEFLLRAIGLDALANKVTR